MMERLQRVSERPKYFVDYRQSDQFQDRVLNQYREMKDRNLYLEVKKRYNTIKSQNGRLEEKLSSQYVCVTKGRATSTSKTCSRASKRTVSS